MRNDAIRIRTASVEDAAALLEIYAPYVKNTAVTFEYEVPSVEEFAGRIRRIQANYPYLLAEADGEPLGYAYANAFQERAAYAWAVETTIYIKAGKKRSGIGSRLYHTLEQILRMQNILNVNACIAYPEQEDSYLTKDSVLFHEKQGYRRVGTFHNCGYKFHRWYNMVWMEKQIGAHISDQPPVKAFPEIKDRLPDSLFLQ